MLLDKNEILRYVADKKISFAPPLDAFQIQPDSVDLRVGWNFYVPESWKYTEAGRVAIEPDHLAQGFTQDNLKLLKLRPGQRFEVLPHELVLVSSLEKIELNCGSLMAILHPRSTMVRRGFVIQGGVVDVNYVGHLTIPVLNATNHKLRLYPGERAYQLLFYLMTNALSAEEAALHGPVSAKYANATAYNLEARSDSEDETSLIKSGDIEGLKKKFKVT